MIFQSFYTYCRGFYKYYLDKYLLLGVMVNERMVDENN